MTFGTELRAYLEQALLSSDITSASPGFINKFIEVPFPDDSILDAALEQFFTDQATKKLPTATQGGADKIGTGPIGDARALDVAGLQIGVGPAELSMLTSFAKNPTSLLLKFMGSSAFISGFLPILLAAFGTQIAIEGLVELLAAPGGPLDRRLKIDFTKRMNAFFSRMDQRRRQIGLDQVILTQIAGFGNMGGALTVNTLNQVKATGLAKIGLNEKAIGLTP